MLRRDFDDDDESEDLFLFEIVSLFETTMERKIVVQTQKAFVELRQDHKCSLGIIEREEPLKQERASVLQLRKDLGGKMKDIPPYLCMIICYERLQLCTVVIVSF
jgi:hypothetical protein